MTKKEEEAIEMERNWADLPPELFPVILKKLPDISDFVRSRAVCKPWRLSSSVSDLAPQFPWIIRLGRGPDLEFYSIALNKVYTIRDPCSSCMRLRTPTGGCMLTSQIDNDDSFSLLNPLNNSEIHFPVLHDCNPYWFSNNISLFNPPSFQIDEHMLVSVPERSFVCKPGDDRWDIIGPGHEYQYRCYYYKGLLFRVEYRTAVTKVMDISSCMELYVIPPPKDEKFSKISFSGLFPVESLGEIFSVCYNHNKTTDYKFYIYRLEFGNGKGNPCWVNLRSIGDRILFLEISLGFGRGFCLRASDFAGFKGNCIYFINKVPTVRLGQVQAINMHDIETGETVCIDIPFDRRNHFTWFMPTLNHI